MIGRCRTKARDTGLFGDSIVCNPYNTVIAKLSVKILSRSAICATASPNSHHCCCGNRPYTCNLHVSLFLFGSKYHWRWITLTALGPVIELISCCLHMFLLCCFVTNSYKKNKINHDLTTETPSESILEKKKNALPSPAMSQQRLFIFRYVWIAWTTWPRSWHLAGQNKNSLFK